MHEEFMQQAIQLAHKKMELNEGGPFAALIVQDGHVIARGWNRVTSTNDPTAHAEIVAIRKACQMVKSFSLENCVLYVNCEPCPMCMAAIYWAGIKQVFYAATRHDAAKIGFADDHIHQELTLPLEQREMQLGQLMQAEALEIFAAWDAKEDKILY